MDLVPAKDAEEGVGLEDPPGRRLAVDVGAVSLIVVRVVADDLGVLVVHRVRPEQVAERPLDRYLLEPVNHRVQSPDGSEVRRDPAMHREILVGDHRRERQAIEQVGKEVIGLLVVLAYAFLAESEMFRHFAGLVIPPQHEEFGRMVQLGRGVRQKWWLTFMLRRRSMISTP